MNKNMETLEIIQHKLIIEKCLELRKVALSEDIDYLKKIIKKSRLYIADFNDKHLTIVDVSTAEQGRWKGVLRTIILGKYYNPIIKKIGWDEEKEDDTSYLCDEHRDLTNTWIRPDGTKSFYYDRNKFCKSCEKETLKRDKEAIDYYKHCENIKNDFRSACDKTIFPENLKLTYILLRRKINKQERNGVIIDNLLWIISDTIHTQIKKTFQEQNKKIIIKYL